MSAWKTIRSYRNNWNSYEMRTFHWSVLKTKRKKERKNELNVSRVERVKSVEDNLEKLFCALFSFFFSVCHNNDIRVSLVNTEQGTMYGCIFFYECFIWNSIINCWWIISFGLKKVEKWLVCYVWFVFLIDFWDYFDFFFSFTHNRIHNYSIDRISFSQCWIWLFWIWCHVYAWISLESSSMCDWFYLFTLPWL